MSSGIPRPHTAPALITSYCRPKDPDPSLTIGELAYKLLALLHLFVFHLFPALIFGILGLILDDAARLFNTAAGFFRKENLPPDSSSSNCWDVKHVLRSSKTSNQIPCDSPLVDVLPGMFSMDSKEGEPTKTSFPRSFGSASEPVTLSSTKLRKCFPEFQGNRATSSLEAAFDPAQVKGVLSELPPAKLEIDPSSPAPVLMSPASSKASTSIEPHVEPTVDRQSTPIPTAVNEVTLFSATDPSTNSLQLSSSQIMENVDDESSRHESSEADRHEVSDDLLEHDADKSRLSLPLVSSTTDKRSGSAPQRDWIYCSVVQPTDEHFASPDSTSHRSIFAQNHSPPPTPCHITPEQSLLNRSGIHNGASHSYPSKECSAPRYLSATNALDPDASDAATADLESQPVSAKLSSVAQDHLQNEVDVVGSKHEVSGGESPLQDESRQKDIRSHAQNFGPAKVDGCESLLIAAESEVGVAKEPSTPESPPLINREIQQLDIDSDQEDSREVLISQLKSTLSSAADSENNSLVKNIAVVNLSKSLHLLGKARDEEGTDGQLFEDQQAAEALGRCSSKAVDVFERPDFAEAFREPKNALFREEHQSSMDAPAGVDSLQELIPEIIPDVTVSREPQPTEQELPDTEVCESPRIDELTSEGTLAEVAIVSVTSMEGLEKLPSFTLPRVRSDTSFKTESYSSPNSPIHSSSTESTSQGRHRDSWRASDHDLFSEDPMIDLEGSSLPASRQLSLQVPGSNFDSAVLEDFDSTKMVTTPALLSKKRTSTNSSENEIDTSTPVTSSADRDSSQSRMEELESVQSWQYCRQSSKCSDDAAERVAYRQASVDVTSRGSPSVSRDRRVLKDRARSRFPRLSPSHGTGRTPIASRVGRPVEGSRLGRSVSTSETRFEDWPEYRPSRDEAPAGLSRRHRSDMSFRSKSRKDVISPEETSESTEPIAVEYKNTEDEIPHRFGGSRRGWKFGFGRSPAFKDGGDVKGVMKNILRRRRKISNLDDSISRNGAVGKMDSHHRFAADKPSRRSIGAEADFSFEIELPQDSAFALLNRICPDCGYRVVVTRPLYKMKIEIPLSGGTTWLLASITLAKVWHGRGTHVSISRSKEDVSGGGDGEIESTGLLLRTRLEAHVEFLEDSFASLKLGSSVQGTKET